MDSTLREDAATTTREISSTFKESKMKFEMKLGFIENEKITVETWDLDKIEIIKDFIEFQEEHGWAVDYVAVDNSEDDTEEEEVVVAGLTSDEE